MLSLSRKISIEEAIVYIKVGHLDIDIIEYLNDLDYLNDNKINLDNVWELFELNLVDIDNYSFCNVGGCITTKGCYNNLSEIEQRLHNYLCLRIREVFVKNMGIVNIFVGALLLSRVTIEVDKFEKNNYAILKNGNYLSSFSLRKFDFIYLHTVADGIKSYDIIEKGRK